MTAASLSFIMTTMNFYNYHGADTVISTVHVLAQITFTKTLCSIMNLMPILQKKKLR